MLLIAILVIATVSCFKTDVENPTKLYVSKDDFKNGTFKSPDYPFWSEDVFSRSYDFIGRPNERVQIIFDTFNLYKKNSNYNCKGDSYVSYRKNGTYTPILLCGSDLPLPIMSDGSRFRLEYKQTKKPSNLNEDEKYGFNGTFRFVTNYGIYTGEQQYAAEGRCEFVYNSTVQKNGSFYSPNYPGYYPKPMNCFYFFEGWIETYLRLNFTMFNLLGTDNCSDPLRDDYVELKQTVDNDRRYYYEKKCGSHESFIVTVNTTFFVIEFQSMNYFVDDSSQQQSQPPFIGFYATYEFTNDTLENGSDIRVAGPVIVFLFTSLAVSKTIFHKFVSKRC